jgi:hypothetical protein
MTSQHGAYVLHAGLIRLHAHAQAPAYPHTRTRVHTDQEVILVLLFHGNNDSQRRLSIKLYVHCLFSYN